MNNFAEVLIVNASRNFLIFLFWLRKMFEFRYVERSEQKNEIVIGRNMRCRTLWPERPNFIKYFARDSLIKTERKIKRTHCERTCCTCLLPHTWRIHNFKRCLFWKRLLVNSIAKITLNLNNEHSFWTYISTATLRSGPIPPAPRDRRIEFSHKLHCRPKSIFA